MAVQDPTDNFNWDLPDVSGDSGNWGTLLNLLIGDDSTGLDAVVFARVRKSGDIMTGELMLLTERYTAVNSDDSGTVTLNLDLANFFHIAPSGSVTIAFSNVPASPDVVFIQIEFTNGTSQTITWPGSIDWPGGTEPTLTSGVDLITGYTRDGGITWRLAHAMSDSS